MVNNTEHRQPYGSDDASTELERLRQERRPTALDEGRAWRHRDTRALVVARIEIFAGTDEAAHRAGWGRLGAESLEATWRERWRERDHHPGWIEAVPVDVGARPEPLHCAAGAPPAGPAASIDWVRVEDHTDPTGAGDVVLYQHLTVWAGRAHAVLVARHDLGRNVNDALAPVAAALHERLSAVDAT